MTSCRYCHATDHIIKDYPQLLAKMQYKRQKVTQPTVQKISTEQRTNDPRVNAVTRSGATTGTDNGQTSATGPAWVRKAQLKQPPFDPLKEWETFFEAKQVFADPGVSTLQNPQGASTIHRSDPSREDQGKNPSHEEGSLRNFLESHMKLIRDQTDLAELQSILSCCKR